MKHLLVLISLIISNWGINQTILPEVKSMLDTTILSAKETSYYTASVNWDSLETEIYKSAIHAQSILDLKPAFEILINGLRDHHGRVMSTKDYSLLASFTDFKNIRFKDRREYPSEIWSIVNNLDSRFIYSLLEGNIGYLKVMAIGPNVDGKAEAERIRCAITKLHNLNVEKWIIDLRFNAGGNINVMLAGLAPLLDTKKVASIQDANDEVQGTAEIKKGNFWYFGQNVFKLKKVPKIKNSKIAILTSRWTASSGELVATAFKGQKDTRFFGEATGGYTTNTGWQSINDEIALVIATGVFCDRNGVSYDENIVPNVEIPFEIEDDKTMDKAILEATKWLLQ